MIKSKFKFWVLLPLFSMILISVSLYLIIVMGIFSASEPPSSIIYLFAVLLFALWIPLVFDELRTKTIAITVDSDVIVTKSYLGMGHSKKFNMSEFDGFSTNLMHSRNGITECLYLEKGHKKLIILSEIYYKNYFELKNELINFFQTNNKFS